MSDAKTLEQVEKARQAWIKKWSARYKTAQFAPRGVNETVLSILINGARTNIGCFEPGKRAVCQSERELRTDDKFARIDE